MVKLRNAFILTPLIAALIACSGGSSGGGSGTTQDLIAIDQENGQQIASAGLSGTSAVQDQSDSTDFLDTSSGTSAVTRSIAMARQILNRATQSFTLECDSGSITLTANDANDSQELDAGDSLSVTFNDCVETEDGKTNRSNGRFVLTINSISADGNSSNATADYQDLTIVEDGETASIDGKMTVDVQVNGDVETITVSGNRVDFSDENETGSLIDFTFRTTTNTQTLAWSESINTEIQSSEIGGRVIVTTPTELQGMGENYPDTGEIVFTGSQGSYTSLNADTGDNDTVLVTVFDGSVTNSDTVNWDDLES